MTNSLLRVVLVLDIMAVAMMPHPTQAQSGARGPNLAEPQSPDSLEVFDFGKPDFGGRVDAKANARIVGGRLHIATVPGQGNAVVLHPPGASWNWDNWTRIEIEVANLGNSAVRLRVRADNKGASDWGNSALNTGFVGAGERKVFNLFLYRNDSVRAKFPELAVFQGMSGLPGGLLSHWHTIEASDVRSLTVEVYGASSAQQLDVFRVRATHPIVP